MTRRLIEDWLPIAEIGIESLRERVPMTPFPAPNRLHVWWARRPLVASRAAVLGSLLPSDANRETFMHILGIHGDPIAARRRIERARKTGENLGLSPYGYDRAFKYSPSDDERLWAESEQRKLGIEAPKVLDPTAGGGSIPLESLRLGVTTFANDLNPVAVLVQRATYELPLIHGKQLIAEYERISKRFLELAEPNFRELFVPEADGAQVFGYLWARTIRCPHCEGLVPLAPNWRLAPDGQGVRLLPRKQGGPGATGRLVDFEIVAKAKEQSPGTVSGGDANCPFDDCARLIPGEHVKNEAQEGRMGEQLYGVVVKRRVVVGQKASGKVKEKWIRAFRAPRDEDDVLSTVRKQLDERMPIWEAMNIVPTEAIGELSNYDRGHRMYGMTHWRDMFSPRQLLGHGYGVEAFRALIQEEESEGRLTDALKGALIYLSFAIDKLLNYNARSTRWDGTTGRIRSVFDSHNFAIVWSYAEMAPTVVGQGFSWAIEETGKALAELVTLCRPDADVGSSSQSHFDFEKPRPKFVPPEVILTCTSGDSLGHLTDGQIDAVVLDPPYYDNVMYAELSDFFYVWLKRTAGYIYPELFLRGLTDKENEAIANPAKFKDQKGGKLLAGRDYQNRMAGIFTEARRVLKPDGIMTLMFTHKATGAWDALTKGLIEAGFTITASWPINTEAEGSLHIKDKSAANSTVFLVCRPRVRAGDDVRYWEEVEPTVRKAVRQRIAQFQEGGIRGVDLYLSCFGPALEAFSQNWPLVRGTPRQDIEQTRRKKRQAEIFEEEYDPYAVTPEDALEVARREVKDWRLHQLAHVQRNVELDNLTSWFVLAWDAFEAPIFPYDEANRLAKVCGVDLDREVVGRLAEKKGSDLVMWDSVTRVAKGSLGLPDGRDSMMDALHHLARTTRSASLESANELLAKHSLANEPIFLLALEAVLEVLPVGKEWSGLDLPDAAEGAGADFDALEKLRRLALSEKVAEPEQLKIWQEESAA